MSKELAALNTRFNLNLSSKVADRADTYFNCMGFALGTYEWEELWAYGCTDNREEELDECVEEMLDLSFDCHFPSVRLIDSPEEVDENEYCVAMRLAEDDFHFVRQMPNGEWWHKPGSHTIRKMSEEEVFADSWESPSGNIIYDSAIILFAVAAMGV